MYREITDYVGNVRMEKKKRKSKKIKTSKNAREEQTIYVAIEKGEDGEIGRE